MFGATLEKSASAPGAKAPTPLPAKPVAGGSPVSAPPKPPVDTSAVASVPRFGGNRGGRPRADKLVPGSPEAIEADRKKETDRKAVYRAGKRAENPPALPSALPGPVAPASNQGQAIPGTQGVGPASEMLAVVSWTPEDLKEFTDQLIPAAEQMCVQRLTSRAAKAKLHPTFLKDVETGSRWDEMTKRSLTIALPRLSAKWLNKAGLSAEYKDEIVLGVCALRLMRQQSALEKKLDELIAESKKEKTQGNEAEKKTP